MTWILNYILKMLPYVLCAVPLVAVFRFAAVSRMKKRGQKTNARHEVLLWLFLLFLAALASQTIIPQWSMGNGGVVFSPGSSFKAVNLAPFLVFPQTWYEVFVNGNLQYFLINFLGNIIMFIPIGFCIPALWRRGVGSTVLIGLLSSVFIEFVQLFQVRGTDVDDLWLNTLGVVLGCGAYRLLARWKPGFFGSCRVG